MSERMQSASGDLQTRTKHWGDVIASAYPRNMWHDIFGFGMGSMPKLYYQRHFDNMPLPNYRWVILDGKSVLQIGKGGYPFYQKLSINARKDYVLTAKVRFEDGVGALGFDLCHKHILFSEHWQAECVKKDFKAINSSWQILEWRFNAGSLGSQGWLDWPPTLQFHNYGDSVVMIDSIEMRDDSGKQIIRNPDFDDKLGYWFWGSDFEHLPWHSKQIFIHIWLEQGWVGLILFFLLLGLGINRQLKLLKLGFKISTALLPAVIAILCLGLTDTFIDEPQTTLMTFSVLFAALQWPLSTELLKSTR